MTTIRIQNSETGKVRLFAVNRSIDAVSLAVRDSEKHAVITDLLGTSVPVGSAELFPVTDLAGVGLTAYLTEGYAVSDDQLAQDRSRLGALDGYVLLLFSSAFEGRDTTLEIGPDLTLIGTYDEEQPAIRAIPLTADAAQPYTGIPNVNPRTPPRDRAGGAMVVLAVLVVLGLILWWLM